MAKHRRNIVLKQEITCELPSTSAAHLSTTKSDRMCEFLINLGYRKWGIGLLHVGVAETPLCNLCPIRHKHASRTYPIQAETGAAAISERIASRWSRT